MFKKKTTEKFEGADKLEIDKPIEKDVDNGAKQGLNRIRNC